MHQKTCLCRPLCDWKKIKEEVNNLSKKPFEKEPTKKWPHANGTVISNFFVAKDSYKKDDV